MTTPSARPAHSAPGVELYAAIDPGRADRLDEACLVVSAAVVLGVLCGLLIHWLGSPLGGVLALVLYLAGVGLVWVCGLGGSS